MSNDKIDPLSVEFFDEDISRFKDNLNKNEELYDEIHSKLEMSNAGGFSLGMSRTASEYAKTLASIRSTAMTGTTQLFSAKKAIADLQLKKKQLDSNTKSEEANQEYLRSAVEFIRNGNYEENKMKKTSYLTDMIIKKDSNVKDKSRDLLNKIVDNDIKTGNIKITKNEKAMKHDFKGEGVEPAYNVETEKFVAIKRDDGSVLKEYPIERLNVSGKIINVDKNTKQVFLESGKIVKFYEEKGDLNEQ